MVPVQNENVDSLLKIIKKFKIVTSENYTKHRNLKPYAIYILQYYGNVVFLANKRQATLSRQWGNHARP